MKPCWPTLRRVPVLRGLRIDEATAGSSQHDSRRRPPHRCDGPHGDRQSGRDQRERQDRLAPGCRTRAIEQSRRIHAARRYRIRGPAGLSATDRACRLGPGGILEPGHRAYGHSLRSPLFARVRRHGRHRVDEVVRRRDGQCGVELSRPPRRRSSRCKGRGGVGGRGRQEAPLELRRAWRANQPPCRGVACAGLRPR